MTTAAIEERYAYDLHPRQLDVMAEFFENGVEQLLYGGAAGGGKLLSILTPIPTPNGWTEMGCIGVGDVVFDERGRTCGVTALSDIEYPVSYLLTFDDGSSIEAGADHQWLTFDAKELAALTRRDPAWRERRRAVRPSRVTGNKSMAFTAAVIQRNHRLTPVALPAPTGSIRTTQQIVDTLRVGGRANHAIPLARPLDLPDIDLPLDPYLLGLWLGDGSRSAPSITTMDEAIEGAFVGAGFPAGKRQVRDGNQAWGVRFKGLVVQLRAAGVLGNKHVPSQYLRASRTQRLALLQGLMDTDGTVSDSGRPEFTNTNKRIIDAAYELIVSLGWKARVIEGRAKFNGRDYGPKWDIKWTPDDYVFRLPRKRDRQVLATRRTTQFRYVVDAQPIEPIPMRCIEVDSPSRLYLAGPSMIPTHNSHLARALAYTLAMAWPGARIPIFRENYTQLIKTQVSRWRIEMAKLGYDVNSPKVWKATDHEFHFPNGSIVEFLHIDQTIGAEKWLSAEWAALIVDESTQLSEEDLKTLYSRVRAPEDMRETWRKLADEREKAGGWRMDWRPLALYLTNPGGLSHAYFLEEFVQPGRANDLKPWIWHEKVSVGGEEIEVSIKRAFVPAFLTDNPSLDASQYAAQLAQIASRVRREQMLSGNWDAFEGKVFDMLDPEVHLVDATAIFGGKRVPPADWPRIAGLDHGTTNPTAVEWTTRDDDDYLITYLEYYSPGAVGTHIQAIKELMMLDGHPRLGIIGDPRMWHKNLVNKGGMHSLAEEYLFNGAPPSEHMDASRLVDRGIKLINPMKGSTNEDARRQTQRIVLQRLLEPDPNRIFPEWHPRRGQYGAPKWFIATACKNLWREMNALQYINREGDFSEDTVKKNDHAYDAVARSVPIFEQALSGGGKRGPRREIVARSRR